MNARSIPHLVRSIARQVGPKPVYMDVMNGIDVTWVEFKNRAWNVAGALVAQGLEPGRGVALIGFDGLDGLELELGCQAAGIVPFIVPTTLDNEATLNAVLISRCSEFILNESGPVDAAAMRATLEPLSLVVSEIPAGDLRMNAPGPAVIPEDSLDDAAVEDRMKDIGPVTPAAGFLHSMPDGGVQIVALSHSNLLSTASAVTTEIMADEFDVWTSLSPLSAPFARIACWYNALLSGGMYSAAPAGKIPVEALFIVQPSFAVCDGPTLALVESGILNELDLLEGARGRITRWGFRHSCERIRQGRETHGVADSLADLAVERLVRDIPGGRLRAIICDNTDVSAESRCRFQTTGVDVWAVFAPASVSCFMAVSHGSHVRQGSVGIPLPGTRVILSPERELVVSGESVMLSEMCQSRTASNEIKEDSLRTGLKGRIDGDGFIFINTDAQ